MEEKYPGGRITSRLQLWRDEELEGFWRVSGKDNNLSALAEPADLTRLALTVLENLGDRRELPAMAEQHIPDAIVELSRICGNAPGEQACLGGTLMAVGLRMVLEARETARRQGLLEDGGVSFRRDHTELPFRLEIGTGDRRER